MSSKVSDVGFCLPAWGTYTHTTNKLHGDALIIAYTIRDPRQHDTFRYIVRKNHCHAGIRVSNWDCIACNEMFIRMQVSLVVRLGER